MFPAFLIYGPDGNVLSKIAEVLKQIAVTVLCAHVERK